MGTIVGKLERNASGTTITLVVTDGEIGTELGSVEVDRVPHGARIEAWHAASHDGHSPAHAGTLVTREKGWQA